MKVHWLRWLAGVSLLFKQITARSSSLRGGAADSVGRQAVGSSDRNKVANFTLPSTNVTLSRIALGGLHFPELKDNVSALVELLETAHDTGITTLDLSDVYGWISEGRGKSNDFLSQAFQLKEGLREKFVLVCKFGIKLSGGYHVDTSPAWIQTSVDNYLRLFNTSYLDVLMIHNPDPAMDHAAVAKKFAEFKKDGSVRAFGISNFKPHEYEPLRDAMRKEKIALSLHEMEISVLHPDKLDDGTVEYFSKGDNQLQILAWGPLGGDPYGGKNLLFESDGAREKRIVAQLASTGEHVGLAADQVAVKWLLEREEHIAPILGTIRPERLRFQGLDTQEATFTSKDWHDVAGATYYR